jgi:hypothetical protein
VIDLLEATLVAELGKPAIDGTPRRQIARQQTLRTARPHHIEDAVDDLAHWPSPWSTRAISRWQVRFDHTPFLISHVRLVSVGLANMLLSGVGIHMATPALVSGPPGITSTPATQPLSKRPLNNNDLSPDRSHQRQSVAEVIFNLG